MLDLLLAAGNKDAAYVVTATREDIYPGEEITYTLSGPGLKGKTIHWQMVKTGTFYFGSSSSSGYKNANANKITFLIRTTYGRMLEEGTLMIGFAYTAAEAREGQFFATSTVIPVRTVQAVNIHETEPGEFVVPRGMYQFYFTSTSAGGGGGGGSGKGAKAAGAGGRGGRGGVSSSTVSVNEGDVISWTPGKGGAGGAGGLTSGTIGEDGERSFIYVNGQPRTAGVAGTGGRGHAGLVASEAPDGNDGVGADSTTPQGGYRGAAGTTGPGGDGGQGGNGSIRISN